MALSKITNGGVAASGIPSGGIIQVQYTQYDTAETYSSVTADTDFAITQLAVDITPTSTSSIIMLQSQICGELGDADDMWNHVLFFFRDSTALKATASSNRQIGVSALTRTHSSDVTSTPEIGFFQYFDSPSSTSQITYKVGMRLKYAGGSGVDFALNRTVTDTDSDVHERLISYISATEIAG